jgi:hypothetical protein
MLKVFKKLNDVALCATFMDVIGVIVCVLFCTSMYYFLWVIIFFVVIRILAKKLF